MFVGAGGVRGFRRRDVLWRGKGAVGYFLGGENAFWFLLQLLVIASTTSIALDIPGESS